jgi:HEAT repeat protein
MMWWIFWRLKSNNDQTRRRAVKGLSRSKDPRALAVLMAALNDKSYLVRKEAARVLGDIGDARAVGPLINLVEESFHYAMARTAVGALEEVLGRAATSVVSEDMQAAAILEDVRGIGYENRQGTAWFSETRQPQLWAMDCSKVRTLAHRELIRRGLTA